MKQKIIACVFLFILSVGYYYVILSYSATPAKKSSAKSTAITRKIVEICDNITGRESSETEKSERVRSLHGFIRKCAHVYNFMILAIAHIMLFFIASEGKISQTIIWTLILGMTGAAFDEFSQLFADGRAGQIKDIFIDFAGTCLCCLVFIFADKICLKEGEKR